MFATHYHLNSCCEYLHDVLHFTQANKDRNKLINQMNARNEELLKQKDANDILRTTLGHGEVEYNKRIDDIRLLKLEVKRLR